MGRSVKENGRDELYGGKDEQSGEIRLDLVCGFRVSEAGLELGETAIIQEDETKHAGKEVENPLEDRKNPDSIS
jgi:hypothetical protein